ncbi:hypothetical protein [Ottowia cancrivicina]|uniref:hypothetical protein n=1 Tax=Ottowia cancrivicina TaxID=3040346 RepID=UPI003D16F218
MRTSRNEKQKSLKLNGLQQRLALSCALLCSEPVQRPLIKRARNFQPDQAELNDSALGFHLECVKFASPGYLHRHMLAKDVFDALCTDLRGRNRAAGFAGSPGCACCAPAQPAPFDAAAGRAGLRGDIAKTEPA